MLQSVNETARRYPVTGARVNLWL